MPFAGGKFDPSEAGRRSGQARRSDPSVAPSDGPVDLLAEYQAILRRPASEDVTPFQKSLRKQYQGDFNGFMDRLVKLTGKEGPRSAEVSGADEGTGQALAVLDRWLKARAEGRIDEG